MDPDTYREIVSDSQSWLRQGQRLLASADALWKGREQSITAALALEPIVLDGGSVDYAKEKESPEMKQSVHVEAFHLLAGYGIENLLKAVHVRRRALAGQPVVSASAPPRLVGIPKNHDLEELAQLQGLELDIGDRLLLQRLSASVRWAGRYPASLDLQENDGMMKWTWSYRIGELVQRFSDRVIGVHDAMR